MAYPTSPADQWSPEPGGGRRMSTRRLSVAVVILGLGSYLFSYGPVPAAAGIGWEVRFAVLAALVAAFGLLTGQPRTALAVAVLASAGFLDGLSGAITVPDAIAPGWALWVIIVLDFLQAVAAIGALKTQPGGTGDQQLQELYAAYAEQYARAAEYYSQYAQQPAPEAAERGGVARADQEHRVPQPAPTAQPASPYGSYAEYVSERSAAPAGQPPPSAPRPSGMPSFGQTQAFAPPHRRPAVEPGQPTQDGH